MKEIVCHPEFLRLLILFSLGGIAFLLRQLYIRAINIKRNSKILLLYFEAIHSQLFIGYDVLLNSEKAINLKQKVGGDIPSATWKGIWDIPTELIDTLITAIESVNIKNPEVRFRERNVEKFKKNEILLHLNNYFNYITTNFKVHSTNYNENLISGKLDGDFYRTVNIFLEASFKLISVSGVIIEILKIQGNRNVFFIMYKILIRFISRPCID
jgi:hypothetical protein